jgi:MFS family permease
MRSLVILRQPHVTHLLLASIVGRIPPAVAALAISLLLRGEGWAYNRVGLVVGVFAVGQAVGGPVLARLVDRRGQAAVLAGSAVLSSLGFLLLPVAGTGSTASLGGAIGCAAVAGLATPPLEPCLRALWPVLVGHGRLDAALGLDAASQELIFIAGPLLVAACAATGPPASALWLAAGLGVLGTLLFLLAPPPRVWRPLGPTGTPHWLGPLRNGRLALLLVALVGSGVAVGAMTLFVVAYADGRPVPGGAGLLLSLNALGAMLGAIGYGAVRWRAEPRRRLALLVAGMAVAYWTLVAVSGPGVLVVLLLVAGAFFAPLLAVSFAMVGTLSAPEHITEAFAWLVTLITAGIALGSLLAGFALAGGLGGGAVAGAAGASVAAVIVLLGQRFWAVPPECATDVRGSAVAGQSE